MGKHLDRVNIGIAVDNAPCDRRAGIRRGGRGWADPLYRPAHEEGIKHKPDRHRDNEPRIRVAKDEHRAAQVGDGKGDRVEHLKRHIARRGRRLHDPVGDPPREIVFKPADRLAQNVPVRPPAHDRPEIRDDGVVQKGDLRAIDDRPRHQDEKRNDQKLEPVRVPHVLRACLRQHIDEPAHIGQEPDLHHSAKDRHDPSRPENLSERLGILAQKRPKPLRRCVGFLVRNVGVDEALEKAKHECLCS